MTRSYGQFCPLARTLDRVGDRWTLLIVRDVAFGPKRYSDLLAGLPGIGTSLLGERLRRLEDDGIVVRRELPPPTPATVYELTEAGRALASALVGLVEWGVRYLDAKGDEDLRPEWLLLYWRRAFDPDAARGVDDVYEFRVDGQVFHVRIDDGELSGGLSEAPREPDVRVTTDWRTFLDVGLGRLEPRTSAARGRGSITGDQAAIRRFIDLLVRRWPPGPALTS